jgi:hypothetical protein
MFVGSKLWTELQLDKEYFGYHRIFDTCLNYCFNVSFKDYMNKTVDDLVRGQVRTCQYNCISKSNYASRLVLESVQNHERYKVFEQDLDSLLEIENKKVEKEPKNIPYFSV